MIPDATATPRRPIALIVDDEETIRLLATRALRLVGFHTEEADDGPAALAAMVRLNPDCILLDAQLPTMDGFRVCQAMRQLPNGTSVPIVMMTGMDQAEWGDRAFEAGATDILGKPFNLVALGQYLWALVQERSSDPDHPEPGRA